MEEPELLYQNPLLFYYIILIPKVKYFLKASKDANHVKLFLQNEVTIYNMTQ